MTSVVNNFQVIAAILVDPDEGIDFVTQLAMAIFVRDLETFNHEMIDVLENLTQLHYLGLNG